MPLVLRQWWELGNADSSISSSTDTRVSQHGSEKKGFAGKRDPSEQRRTLNRHGGLHVDEHYQDTSLGESPTQVILTCDKLTLRPNRYRTEIKMQLPLSASPGLFQESDITATDASGALVTRGVERESCVGNWSKEWSCFKLYHSWFVYVVGFVFMGLLGKTDLFPRKRM